MYLFLAILGLNLVALLFNATIAINPLEGTPRWLVDFSFAATGFSLATMMMVIVDEYKYRRHPKPKQEA